MGAEAEAIRQAAAVDRPSAERKKTTCERLPVAGAAFKVFEKKDGGNPVR